VGVVVLEADAVAAGGHHRGVGRSLRHNNRGGNIDISTISAPARATITVTNTGPTVPASKIDRLFQPFQQAGNERVGHTNGHGFGLAIVGAIAKAHQAKITAHPRPHGGLDIAVTFGSSEHWSPSATVAAILRKLTER
jgi:signal transduction histidine kinase